MFGECLHPPSLFRWLIEVNASPSHTPSSQEDYEMKCRLLEDTLNVVDMEGRWNLRCHHLASLFVNSCEGSLYIESLQTMHSFIFTRNPSFLAWVKAHLKVKNMGREAPSKRLATINNWLPIPLEPKVNAVQQMMGWVSLISFCHTSAAF